MLLRTSGDGYSLLGSKKSLRGTAVKSGSESQPTFLTFLTFLTYLTYLTYLYLPYLTYLTYLIYHTYLTYLNYLPNLFKTSDTGLPR